MHLGFGSRRRSTSPIFEVVAVTALGLPFGRLLNTRSMLQSFNWANHSLRHAPCARVFNGFLKTRLIVTTLISLNLANENLSQVKYLYASSVPNHLLIFAQIPRLYAMIPSLEIFYLLAENQ